MWSDSVPVSHSHDAWGAQEQGSALLSRLPRESWDLCVCAHRQSSEMPTFAGMTRCFN